MAEHNWHEVATRTWDVLTQAALEKRRLYYSELAERLRLHHRLMRFPLDLLQDYCLEERKPPLTIMVIERATSSPGSGFTGAPREAWAASIREVLEWNWRDEPNPYEFARDGTAEAELIAYILDGPDRGKTVIELVPGRGPQQSLFRKALLTAYRGRCAFSGANLEGALEAAHIVPWAHATDIQRVNVQNGLLLNVYFHRLYWRRRSQLASSELRRRMSSLLGK